MQLHESHDDVTINPQSPAGQPEQTGSQPAPQTQNPQNDAAADKAESAPAAETVPAAEASDEPAKKPADDAPKHPPKREKPQASADRHGRQPKADQDGNPVKKRSRQPVQDTKPSDIRKPQVSFMNSIANLEPASRARWTGSTTAQAYDHAVMQSEQTPDKHYEPKIRKMTDSTRAKERRSHRRPTEPLPYLKDTPVETVQSLPARKRKKRKSLLMTGELDRIPEKLTKADSAPLTPKQQTIADASEIDFSVGTPPAEQVREIPVREKELRKKREEQRREKNFQQPEDRATVQKDLNELSTSLSLRAALIGLIFVCSAVITVLDWIPQIPMPQFLSSKDAPVSFLTIQILLGLLSLPFSGDLLRTGYMKLIQLRADSDSLTAMSMVSSMLAAILLLPSPGMLSSGVCSTYISVGLLSLWLNTLSKKMIVSRAIRNFAILSDNSQKYGIRYVEDEKRAENLTRGTIGDFPILAAMQPVDNPKDFLKYTFSSDLGDRFCRTAVPLMFVLSAAFSIVLAVLRAGSVESAVCYGTSLFALCFSAFACTAITLISNLPMESGTKAYVRNSGLLLGYQSVDDFYDVNTVMVDARTLFPKESTKLESVELFGDARTEDVIFYAAALTRHGGSILRGMFLSAMEHDDRILPTVEDYSYDEGKGISGWIHNQRVLLGTREMMSAHSIEGLPPAAREDEAAAVGNRVLYLSVSGTAAAMFTIRLTAAKTVKHWLRALDREQIFLLIRSNDPLLSQRGIAKMFAFPEDLLKVIPSRLEPEYAAETVPMKTARPSMLCAGRLPGFIQTIVGAKRIRSAATLGLILQIVTACLGFLYVLLFVLLHDYEDINGGLLLVYHVICTVITVCSIRLKDT
ncbi:MAG: hypothetical protein II723_05040 [Oscillospiraceae bacterium]|nr:hypothetical protein [Oscillospiraceae bacterium]